MLLLLIVWILYINGLLTMLKVKKLSLLCVCLSTFAIGLSAKTIVLYHTSDTHGFFYPENGQGGVAALAAVVRQEKLPHLLLDSGDFANGTIETKNSRRPWGMMRLRSAITNLILRTPA